MGLIALFSTIHGSHCSIQLTLAFFIFTVFLAKKKKKEKIQFKLNKLFPNGLSNKLKFNSH